MLGIAVAGLGSTLLNAQDVKPSAKDVAANRTCVAKTAKDTDAAEQRCVLRLVATPCTNRPQAKSTAAIADCYRVEQAIWRTFSPKI